MRRYVLTLTSLLLLVLLLAVPASADTFPDIIPLPNGWRPEGIASGRGTTFYAGSLADGAIYRGDFRTGEGAVFVDGIAGNVAVGMYVDQPSNYLFVAGGPTGQGRVYDAASGELLETYQFQTDTTFVNDVVVTREAAYFTDSFRPILYRVALCPAGALTDGYEEIPLTGDFVQASGFNANGIEATPDGTWLLIVQSVTGQLFRVDPHTGAATSIDLGGALLSNGDGLRFAGQYLYVVQNRLNQIAEVRLSAELTAGEVLRTISDSAFQVPTTIASFGDALYAVNARFDITPTPTTEYEAVRVVRR
jgi:sugar lactone lactonase YvrE